MMTSSLFGGMQAVRASVICCRNLSSAPVLVQKASDPIQQLFLDKIREYKQKSSGGKLLDPTPAIQKEMKQELEKLEKRFGGGSGVDMTSFPSFKFDEPKLDPINEQAVANGGKLVDPSPAIEKEMKTELEKLEKAYGGGQGVDMTAFPSFKFDQTKLDPIDEAPPEAATAKGAKGGKDEKKKKK